MSRFARSLALALTTVACSAPESSIAVHRTSEPVPAGAGAPGSAPPAAAAPPASTGTASPSSPPAQPGPVAGSITIHSGRNGFVMLDDGKQFVAPIKANGSVTFTDASIVGPQTITFAEVGTNGHLLVESLVGVDRKDVFVRVQLGSSTSPKRETVISGSVSSTSDAPGLGSVRALGVGDSGINGVVVDLPLPGQYSMPLWTTGAATGEVDLLAEHPDGDGVAFGMRTVKLGAANALDQDIVVDHRAVVPTTVRLTGEAPYFARTADGIERSLAVRLQHQRGLAWFESRSYWTSSAVSSATDIENTGAFAAYTPFIEVEGDDLLHHFAVRVRVPRMSTTTQIALPPPSDAPVLLAPPNASISGATVALPPGVTFSWANTSSGELTETWIHLYGAHIARWRVVCDGATHAFKPFELPPMVGALRWFPKGVGYVSVERTAFANANASTIIGAPPEELAKASAGAYLIQRTDRELVP